MQAWVAEFAEVNIAFKEDVWNTVGGVGLLDYRAGVFIDRAQMFINSPFTGPSHGAVISFPKTLVSCFKALPVSPSPMPSLFVIRLQSHSPTQDVSGHPIEGLPLTFRYFYC